MSRDRRDRPEARDREAQDPEVQDPEAGDPERAAGRSADLLTAYVDGVAELPADERRGVERWLADDSQARADADAVHGLLGRLRALPPTYDRGEPPDWAAMERSIRQAVADDAPRPWWRSWRWLAPAMTCAAAAAVVVALWPRLAQSPGPVAVPRMAQDHAPPPGHEPPGNPGNDLVALWLDGSEVDVDLARPEAVDQVLGDALLGSADGPALRSDELDAARAPVDELGVLPSAGMAWVDDLDDAALDRAERLLANPPAAPARSKG
jgi:hypothetical protein